jgi:hypothetical protein
MHLVTAAVAVVREQVNDLLGASRIQTRQDKCYPHTIIPSAALPVPRRIDHASEVPPA